MTERLSDYKAVRFLAGQRKETNASGQARDVVRVAVEIATTEGWWHTDNMSLSDLPDFLRLDRGSRLYASNLSEDETRKRLLDLGWMNEPRVFLWYRPNQLAFYVDKEGSGDGALVIIDPIEDCCDFDYEILPYNDDLRGDALEDHPPFLGEAVGENMFELAEALSVGEIRKRMRNLGYVYDTSLADFI